MQYKNRYLYYAILPCCLFLIAIGVYVSGYNPPTEGPPFGNLPAPINAGLNQQTKAGNLIIEGNLTTGGVFRLGQFDTAPAGAEGALYYDTTDKTVKVYIDGKWTNLVGAARSVSTCAITTGSCDDTTVFGMSATSGGHAELPGQGNYNNYVCCSGVAGLGTSCTGNYATVLKLSSLTNAHVEKGTLTNYEKPVCLSVSSGTVTCKYVADDCSTLVGDYTCLASISGETSAHVGNCSAYATKVCCEIVSQ